ncbi:hypothetical protein B296_00016851, partial [Ensete ventricosum]
GDHRDCTTCDSFPRWSVRLGREISLWLAYKYPCNPLLVPPSLSLRGEDVLKDERLGQGFTHAFLLTFGSAEDLATYIKHPSHVEYGKAFRAAIDKVLAIDFPVVPKGISS